MRVCEVDENMKRDKKKGKIQVADSDYMKLMRKKIGYSFF